MLGVTEAAHGVISSIVSTLISLYRSLKHILYKFKSVHVTKVNHGTDVASMLGESQHCGVYVKS